MVLDKLTDGADTVVVILLSLGRSNMRNITRRELLSLLSELDPGAQSSFDTVLMAPSPRT
jgi:hypothetical protein